MLSKTRFQSLVALTHKKERLAHGWVLVEGWRWLEEALKLPQPPEVVLVADEATRTAEQEALLARARAAARESYTTTIDQLSRLTDTVSPPGVAAWVPWKPALTLPATNGSALAIALDGVADPGNAGTIIRTADWFGAVGVILGEGSADVGNPKLVRSTMGSLFHLPILQPGPILPHLQSLRSQGFSTVGAALDGLPLPDFTWPDRCLLLIGNEAAGIRPEAAVALDYRVRIPSHGRAESLNAAIAAAVLMADWRKCKPKA